MPCITVAKENSQNIDIYYKDWDSGYRRTEYFCDIENINSATEGEQ
jgi:hypothetical protein